MFQKFSFLAIAALLSSCAYTMDGTVHDLTVRTPGAQNAECNVYVEKLRYKFYTPETRKIFRSKEDLIIDCLAPGGRRKKVVIKPKIAQPTNWNFINGVVPGMGWDYASQAMFEYPSVVEVDFTHSHYKDQKAPAHNSSDVRQPEDYDLEEFLPSQPRLNSDRYLEKIEPRPRQPYGGFGVEAGESSEGSGLSGARSTMPPTSNDYDGKGDLMDVIQRTGAAIETPSEKATTAQPTVTATEPALRDTSQMIIAPPVSTDDGNAGASDGAAEPPMPMIITPDNFGESEAEVPSR